MVNELANEEKPQLARQVAGMVLKQQFYLKNAENRKILATEWFKLDEELKNKIRNQILFTMGSKEKDARKVSALVLSTIANIELPNGQWNDLIPNLTQNVINRQNPFSVEASLMALGYICEETRCPQLSKETDSILNAIAIGMSIDNIDIRIAAVNALLNTLEFAEKNFNKENERNYIMKLVTEACVSQSPDLRRVGLQCLVKIANNYYEILPQYIKYIFETTTNIARNDEESVALQAIEFWTTVSEVESLIKDEEEYLEEGETLSKKCYNFIQSALFPLVQLLQELLVRQEEFQTDDDNNISNAAGTCLSRIAHVVGDKIVTVIFPFIQANLNNPDWHYKEAATLAFSAILDGPSSNQMNELVNRAIPMLLVHINDPNALVKDTTVFTLGRIACFQPTKLIEFHLEKVIIGLIASMNDEESRVASKACWAIHNICLSFNDNENDHILSNALSPYFEFIYDGLVRCSERQDISENNLRLNVYEAIGSLIQACSRDKYQYLFEKVVGLLLGRLVHSLSTNVTEEKVFIQGLLCGTLQVCTEKLKSKISHYSDEMVKAYLTLLTTSPQIYDDVLMAFGALIDALEENFQRYIDHFFPFLIRGLENFREESVFCTSISVVGALCGALSVNFTKYSDEIMKALLNALDKGSYKISPNIISCFSDIALAVGGNFERYLPYVSKALANATNFQVDPRDEEMVKYQNDLRENVLEAYIGILQGLKGEKPQAFNILVDPIFVLLKMIYEDQTVDKIVFMAAITLICDLANVYGKKLKNHLNENFIYNMIADAKEDDDIELKRKASIASNHLQRINS